ncbi:MAG: S53 family peptidase [Burkholderiaceae bacterium]|jgi:subtilase family serine protease
MNLRLRNTAACIGAAFGVLSVTCASAATPYPTKETPAALDVGAVTALSGVSPITVTLPLKLRNPEAAERFVQALYEKGGSSYHKFLTPDEFRAQFGQTDAEIAKATAHLAQFGLTVERVGASTLHVTGLPANLERAFSTTLHEYEVPAHGTTPAFRYRAPLSKVAVPSELSSIVDSVIGLNTRPRFSPHNVKAPPALAHPQVSQPKGGGGTDTTDPPGSWTVKDFEEYYDVLPLISKGISGSGRTLGIVTLASFTPSDAFAYWAAVGLKVDPNRIHIVNVDGGPGAPSDDSGSDETTLDVEQSGGIAPGAEIVVYQAPNTNQAFLDAFVLAVEHNHAESVSTSWGAWEWFNNLENSPVTDPYSGETVGEIAAFHEVFLQAAVQGQSFFAAAGDGGAYDANRFNLPPTFSLILSVDSPASDVYMTAAGGTTLPGVQSYAVPTGTLNIDVPHERAWSWDYLTPLCNALGLAPIPCGIFPVGTGGGVSSFFHEPGYQFGISGTQRTKPGQSFTEYDLTPPVTYVTLPAYYQGRNVPDISFNADPQTGYIFYYTSSVAGFGIDVAGGTSFVAPQLNGVTALLGQYLHGRVGLLNFPLYDLARSGGAYWGKFAPYNVIKYGNNDFYTGRDGFSPAVGIGTMNVSNFAEALKHE